MEKDIDSFLLIGQSNMCGRGIIGRVPPIPAEGVRFMLRNGRWTPMSEPINPDRRIFVDSDNELRSGVSLAASFAEAYTNATQRKIGLIPCAEGGSAIREWQPGEVLFDHAVMQTKLALRSSRLRGILWHQGESDSHNLEEVQAYEPAFLRLMRALLDEVNGGEPLPIVIGEISTLVQNRWPCCREINAVLHKIAAEHDNIAIASAEGLDLSPDGMHFSAAAYRTLGRRYFEAYQTLVP